MKKNIYVVILIALTSCNQYKSSNTIVDNVAGDSIIEESYQTDNDTIEPFQTQAEINEACYNDYVANADSVENDKKGNEVTTRSYTFSNFVIYARLDPDGRYIISRIILSNRNSVTPEGIGIGSNAEDVLKTYGSQYTDNGNSITYSSGTTDLTFFFTNGSVSDIVYNYNKFS